MFLSFFLEFSLFCYLCLYMISFFIERDVRFLFFFLFQVIFILFGIVLNSPFVISDYFFLGSDVINYFFKCFSIFLFFIFISFFFILTNTHLKSNSLLPLDKFNGIFEFILLTIIFLLAGFLFISSNDFLLIYIFLEIQSICLYILAAFQYDSNRSTEASLKYFVFGAVFSGLFLLGWTFIFATSGLSNFLDILEWQSFIEEYLIFNSHSLGGFIHISSLSNFFIIQYRFFSIGLFFLIISIIGKLGLFPLHFWMIDVYDSISSITLFFFSLFPKLFLIGFLIRLFLYFKFFLIANRLIHFFFLFSALGSILLGSLSNLSQWKIQRFLAFSSLVNLGYILFFFALGYVNFISIAGIILNLIIYLFMVCCFFSIFLFLQRSHLLGKITDLNELFMLKNNYPLLGFSLFINMLSFAGVPPLMGFFGKFYILMFLVNQKMFFSLFFVLFVSLITAFYYIRIARTFFNFNSVRVLHKEVPFSVFFINFIFILIQVFFFIFLFFYFFPFLEFLFFYYS